MTRTSTVSAGNASQPNPRPPVEKDEGKFKRTLKAADPKTKVQTKPEVEQRVEQPQPRTETRVAQANIIPPDFPGVRNLPPGAEVVNVLKKPDGGWSFEVRMGGGANAGDKTSPTTSPDSNGAGQVQDPPKKPPSDAVRDALAIEGDTEIPYQRSLLNPSKGPFEPARSAGESIGRFGESIGQFFGDRLADVINQFIPGGEIKSTAGLDERSPGVFFDEARGNISPSELPFFKPATAGVLNDGRVDSVINVQMNGRLPIAFQLPVGTEFKKGDVLFRQEDPALQAQRQQFESRLGQIENEISVSLARAPNDIAALDQRIAAVTEQIRLQENKVRLLTSEVSRFAALNREGAVPNVEMERQQRSLDTEKQVLAGYQGDLAQLQGQRRAAGEIAAINPEQVLQAARSGNTAALSNLPPETRGLANEYLRTTQQLADVKTREAALTVRADRDGVVVGNVPGRFPGFDGQTLGINQTPGSQADTANYGTFAIAPRADAKAVVSVSGIPPEVAGKVRPGDTLPIESSQFGVGRLRVTNVIDRGRNLGVEVQGTPVFMIGNGERPATVGDLKAPVRVAMQKYDDLVDNRTIVRPTDQEPPSVARANRGSSPNVTFGAATDPEFKVNQFPTREQTVQIRVPVTVDAAGEPGTVKEVGTITVEARVSSDGNKLVPKGDATAVFQPTDRQGSATTIDVDIVPVATANVAGSPQAESGFEIRVRGQVTPNVQGDATGISVTGGTGDTKKPVAGSGTGSYSSVPVAPRQVPVLYSIQFGASGRRDGDDPIATVVAPSMVNVSRLSNQP